MNLKPDRSPDADRQLGAGLFSLRLAAALFCGLLLPALSPGDAASAWAAGATQPGPPPPPPPVRPAAYPRLLRIQVRDTPPSTQAGGFYRGSDRSYTVSTGDAQDRDDSPRGGTGNGYTVGTQTSQWELRVHEGEPVRVDLPSVQTLQFHVPSHVSRTAAGTGAAAGSGGRGGAAGAASGVTAGSGRAGALSGVVAFEAVSTFSARFAVRGAAVRIQLVPLRSGGVQAPLLSAEGDAVGPIVLQGRIGEWIALGDTELPPAQSQSLSLTADPPQPASVWVRVNLDRDPVDRDPAAEEEPTGSGYQRP